MSKNKKMQISSAEYDLLVNSIGELLVRARKQVAKTINITLLKTYWNIGKRIVEFEQKGGIRAEYGAKLLIKLSKDLRTKYGKGFSRSNLQYMRLLYLKYPKCQTLSDKLTWSHEREK